MAKFFYYLLRTKMNVYAVAVYHNKTHKYTYHENNVKKHCTLSYTYDDGPLRFDVFTAVNIENAVS
jgi:hypothetical protein